MHTDKQVLHGKVALVTGSAVRIGAAYNRRLHAAGATVIVHYRHSSIAATALANELNDKRADSAFAVQANLSSNGEIKKLVQKTLDLTGRLDILVNNASSFYPTVMGEVSEEHWDDLLSSNLKAPFFLSQAAMPHLKRTHGVIVNMVDIHGQRQHPDHSVYCSAKAGLIMLTRSMAKELAPEIRVNAIAPGSILWPEGAATLDDGKKETILQEIALQRQGSPTDLAKTLMFLVSPESAYITGQILAVDGGRSL